MLPMNLLWCHERGRRSPAAALGAAAVHFRRIRHHAAGEIIDCCEPFVARGSPAAAAFLSSCFLESLKPWL